MTKVLKTLTDTVYDSVEGYRKASEKADSPALKSALQDRLQQREKTLATMNAELQRHGEDLVTKGTVTGELHQMWMSIADLFERGDEAAAERVEEGEDYLKSKFEAALDNDSLEPGERSVIQECYNEVCAGEAFGDQIARQYD